MNTRKPKFKDKIFGAKNFFKDLIKSLILLNLYKTKFNWIMMIKTLKGNFEIVE